MQCIRTGLELFRRYSWRKFIVVVPSVAVRDGVLKTFQITERHLRELYANSPYKFAANDSENLSQVRRFATSANAALVVLEYPSHCSRPRMNGPQGCQHRRPV